LRPISPLDPVKANEIDELIAVELAKLGPLGAGAPVQRPALSVDDLQSEARRGLEKYASTSTELADMSEALRTGHTISADRMQELVGEFCDLLTLDRDLLATIVSMRHTLGEYLFDHCMNVALLSMSMAAQLGVDREQILAIGLGCVLQDVGMLRVPERIRLAPRDLTSDEWMEILHHPVHTLDALERIRGLPAAARFVGYQVHERTDGTGYPRARSTMTTHPFAKIAAVADVYAAMIGPRPHRDAILPHKAVKELLLDVGRGKFDRAIARAFLDTVSAYPIGSLVELSKGVVGKVIRANPGAHTQPVVLALEADGTSTDWVIDVAKETRVKVVRAVSATGGPSA
jgi:HD-GYP domain-containing protein (c-di-GMP phosphodiesterase class II)